ncbi:hypothetical protein HPB50_022942 [Hyalomma asiaticum]|uniref:Uncharacterized protein n=1 Tax=Hyalomma asiaticum TaxID=266040 RepID=A0ACB7T3F0_HYAAI|nr:hypothetical protein HPB50_022942 [Hyalomma asiaticum]
MTTWSSKHENPQTVYTSNPYAIPMDGLGQVQKRAKRGEETIDGADERVESLNGDVKKTTQKIAPEVRVDNIDCRLAHLWEARTSLHERRNKQRHNQILSRSPWSIAI